VVAVVTDSYDPDPQYVDPEWLAQIRSARAKGDKTYWERVDKDLDAGVEGATSSSGPPVVNIVPDEGSAAEAKEQANDDQDDAQEQRPSDKINDPGDDQDDGKNEQQS
jgi:hypothetical protein